jgi:acyl-coenzyme A synthetase/AMP-(fatty) acid ligase
VIPVPDEEADEVPKAFAAARGSISPDDVIRFVADHVAACKKLRAVEIVDEIPKSASARFCSAC